jgi:superfamily II DNA or RNA helicase
VIPTGGGKTTTAVKAVSALYDAEILNSGDRVLWVVHRDELRRQASESFGAFASSTGKPDLPSRVDIKMLSEIRSYLANNPSIRFAVIDEAHHVAARSYQPMFERSQLGILGLTATPSRHDGQPLQFSRESYSIGFPDLVSMGVLLRPNVIRVDGGAYAISDIGDDSEDLEALNNDERNTRITKSLVDNASKLNKVIIYVGTKKHARDLYQLLKSSALAHQYESISMILGDERRRYQPATLSEMTAEPRRDFIEAQKRCTRSILVNVDVLTEGYDDPSVNAIVMARPTNSKLVYMQAMGRAVRIDPNNLQKEAYVIEVVDDLPNIKYRIDNRWLYSDISDLLEPAVTDVFFSNPDDLLSKITETFERFNVPQRYRVVPQHSARDRITLLLFKSYVGDGRYEHIPLVITNDTRQAGAGFFDFLASRMKYLHGVDIEQAFRPVLRQATQFSLLREVGIRRNVFQAMENAWEVVSQDDQIAPAIQSGRPWVSFVAFRLQLTEEALGDDLLQFTEDMLNRDSVRATLRSRSVDINFMLIKLPMPLRGSWGIFLPPHEFAAIQETVKRLEPHTAEPDGFAQWKATVGVLGTTSLPIEQRYAQSLATIVRERLDYYRSVDPKRAGSRQ